MKVSTVWGLLVLMVGLASCTTEIVATSTAGPDEANELIIGTEATAVVNEPGIPAEAEVVADVEQLEDDTGFSTTLGVLVSANNVYDEDVVRLIHEFTVAAENRDDGAVVSSSSLVNTMAKIIKVADDDTDLAPSSDDIVAAAGAEPLLEAARRRLDAGEAVAALDAGEIPTHFSRKMKRNGIRTFPVIFPSI